MRHTTKPCSVDGCVAEKHYAKTFCYHHYRRWVRWGDPTAGQPPRPRGLTPEDRFWSHVDTAGPDDCWLWKGAPSTSANPGAGYARFRIDESTRMLAHRFSYELAFGPIPDGLVVDHTCHNRDATCTGKARCLHRRCVNPAHLEAVTQDENVRRGVKQYLRRTAA